MPLLPADVIQPSLQTILRINLDGTCIIIIAPNKRGYFSKKVPFRYGVFLTV